MSDESAGHSPLIRYLRVTDYDALELVFAEIDGSDRAEVQFIQQVLKDWKEEQAISNLLFYPALIPETLRFESIIKALDSGEAPYYVLAAIVGLQTIKASEWSAQQRQEIGTRLITILSQDTGLLAARASIAVWDYIEEIGEAKLLGLYPVVATVANRNIIAYLLTRHADTAKKKLKQSLKAMGIKWSVRRKFVKRFKRYLRGRRSGKAVFMQAPQYVDIPSLADVDQRVLSPESIVH